jgi:predicted nucleic acid-binding protein
LGPLDDIPDGSRVALDSSTLIYFIEEHDVFGPLVDPLFEAVAEGRLTAVVSVISLVEVLVGPLRDGNATLASQYQELLLNSAAVSVATIDNDVALVAAAIRSEHKLALPDALIAATATVHQCVCLVANDAVFRRVPGFRTLLVQDYTRN